MPDKITLSSVRAKYPQYADIPDDDLLIGLHRKFYKDMPAGQFFGRIDYDTQREKLLDEATKESGGVRANLGAGLNRFREGVAQLFPGGGPSDAELQETRARDQRLADSTTGGALLQGAGEALPLLALPVGGLAAGGVRGAMQAGAAAGALGGWLSPSTEDESRLGNAAQAAMLGAVLPGAGSMAPKAARGVRGLLTEAGARSRAAEQVASVLPERGKVLLQAMEGQAPGRIGKTAAQQTGDANLAALEAGSRARPSTQPSWADFDARQNAAKMEALQGMAPSELRLQRLDAVRQGRTAPMREGALEAAGKTGGYAEPVLAHADNLLAGDTGANPAVRSIATYVRGALGENPTPGRLYETRKVLADKLGGKSMIGDELGAAAKGARRETQGMLDAIDAALDASSSGQWTPYLQDYAARSKPITSGKVLRETMGKLESKPLVGTAEVASPQITAAGFDKALQAEGRFGDKLTPAARADVEGYRGELRAIEAPGRTRKLAGTMGGGSQTAMDTQMVNDLASRVFEAVMPGGRVLTKAAGAARGMNAQAVERHLAQLLQSPTELGAALRALPPEQLNAVAQRMLQAGGVAEATAFTR